MREVIEKIIFVVSIIATVLAVVLGIVLACMGRLNFFNGLSFIIFIPALFGFLYIAGSLIVSENNQGMFWVILVLISTLLSIYFVIKAFLKGLNPDITQWQIFWRMFWQYLKAILIQCIILGIIAQLKNADERGSILDQVRNLRK